MKLISAHINGFGNISGKDFNFNEDITSFCEKNGFGKSTLAAFIKHMFYGTTTNDKDIYRPHNTNDFRGTLTFSLDSDIYRIERDFSKNNSFKIFKNTSEISLDNNIPGEYFFSLNKESFDKTMLINSSDLEIEAKEDIKAKMANYVLKSSDSVDSKNVIKALNEKKSIYVNNKNTGKIELTKNKLATLKNLEEQNDDLIRSLPSKEKELVSLNEEITSNKNQIISANEYDAKVRDKNQSIELEEEYKKKEKEYIDYLNSYYPNGIPEVNEEEKIQEELALKHQYERDVSTLDLTSQEKEKLDSLSNHFSCMKPSVDVIKSISNDINQYNLCLNQKIVEFTDEENKIIELFDNNNDNISKLEAEFSNYKAKKTQLNNIPSHVQQSVTSKRKTSSKLSFICSIISVLIIAVGIILGFVISTYLFILCGVGLLLLGVGAFLYLNTKNTNNEIIMVDNEEYKKKEKEINDIVINLKATFLYFSVYEDTIDDSYFKFKEKYNKYLSLKEEKERNIKVKEETSLKLKELKDKISSFFISYKYDISNDFSSILMSINSDLKEYENLIFKQNQTKDKKDKLNNDIKEINILINSFIDKYQISDIDLYCQNALTNRLTLSIKSKAKEESKTKYENFISTHEIDETINPVEIDVKEISDLNDKLTTQKTNFENEINNIKTKIAENQQEIDTKDDLEEELKTYQHYIDIIDKTIKAIKTAKSNLNAKYLNPVKTNITKYSSLLNSTFDFSKVELNEELNIRMIDNGQSYDKSEFSSGETVIYLLCYRLAILDEIFSKTKDKNFLIIDDVFMNLDDENIKKVIPFLHEISKERQIIYFTCHSSRKLI